MGRKSLQISYAHLNDCKGDISKKWYVEYSYRLPDNEKKHVYRIYDGLCSGTDEARRANAAKIISVVNDFIKSGEYLNHSADYSPIRRSDDHRPEVQVFNKAIKELQAETLIKRFLKYIKPTIRPKTYMDYSGKLA